MSEFFLELFSEEIPSRLQINARNELTQIFKKFFNDNEIIDKRIKIINTNRGGKITLHNPGQKVVYFVIDLNKRKRDVRLSLIHI